MKLNSIMYAVLAVLLSSSLFSQKQAMKITYPATAKGNTVDTYFGTQVADPYRWLEDDLSKETEAWVIAQNKVTFDYLSRIPYREALKEKLTKIWNYEKFSAPFKRGEYTYFYKNDGLQNQSVLYRQKGNGAPEIFLNPNTFSKDGTTSLTNLSFTKDGSIAAYGISEGGSDWNKIIVIDALSKKMIGDTIYDVKFSGISWYKKDGFYYSSYDKPTGSELSAKTDQHKLYYHKLGTAQKEDQLIFGGNIKRRYVGGSVTENEKYLIVSAATSTSGNELYFKDLSNPNGILIHMVNNVENDCDVIEADDEYLYIFTNKDAPNSKVMKAPVKNPTIENWQPFIPETTEVLSATTGAGYFFAHYMKDAVSTVKQYDKTGKLLRTIELPGIGTARGFGARQEDKEVYYTFTNYVFPPSIYQLDPVSGKSAVYKKPNVQFNPENYESKQVFYLSKDGTRIPMIITYKKGTVLNGKNPTILYGYGGFNISLTPSFSVTNAVWLDLGGVYAVPNLRGGGEYGKTWHDAGTQLKKQNVFDDFIAAAQYLIDNKYTSSDYLAIFGGSNGGLLVGATMTQRPELMKVALPAVGVLDMLRYHTFTAGAGWAYDYGTSEQSAEMFQYLKGYSPVHNVKKGVQYPATMITTGDHDDRVVPAHSFKFAAELQDKQTGNNPVLIRIETNAGHGAGTPVAKSIEQYADMFSFTLYNMGFETLPGTAQ